MLAEGATGTEEQPPTKPEEENDEKNALVEAKPAKETETEVHEGTGAAQPSRPNDEL